MKGQQKKLKEMLPISFHSIELSSKWHKMTQNDTSGV